MRAIDATEPVKEVSSRYVFVSTAELVQHLTETDEWQEIEYKQVKARRKNHDGYQRHMVVLQHKSMEFLPGIRPRVVLINSHDRTSRIYMYFGLYVKACENGLVTGEFFGDVSKKHVGSAKEAALIITQTAMRKTPFIIDTIRLWQNITLNPSQRVMFAADALRLKDGKKFRLDKYDMISLLTPLHGAGQDAPTLWNVYNTVQRKLIYGGRYMINKFGNTIQTKGVSNVRTGIALNAALWKLAESAEQTLQNAADRANQTKKGASK